MVIFNHGLSGARGSADQVSSPPTHLRLVTDAEAAASLAGTAPKRRGVAVAEGEQLTFDFWEEQDPQRLIVLVAMDAIHGRTLCELILRTKPRVALDMRYAVRFDLPGTNRTQVFLHFHETNTMYSKSSIPWHQLKAADFMIDRGPISQRLYHEVLERNIDPIMLLVPQPDHARFVNAYLNRKMSEHVDHAWRIEQAV